MHRTPSRNHPRPPAFTLVELLMVIGILSILMVIGLTVGSRVTGAGRKALTMETLKVMDASLSELMALQGRVPAPVVADPRNTTSGTFYLQPIADGVVDRIALGDDTHINSAGLYMLQAAAHPTVESIYKSLDSRIVRDYAPKAASKPPPNPFSVYPALPTAHDGFGRPIRYVHPAFDGLIQDKQRALGQNASGNGFMIGTISIIGPAQSWAAGSQNTQFGMTDLRRTAYTDKDRQADPTLTPGDSDGGICPGGRPYFYSAGPDGDPSTTDDNIYLALPQFERQPQ